MNCARWHRILSSRLSSESCSTECISSLPSYLKDVIIQGKWRTWLLQKSLKNWGHAWIRLDLKLSMKGTQSTLGGGTTRHTHPHGHRLTFTKDRFFAHINTWTLYVSWPFLQLISMTPWLISHLSWFSLSCACWGQTHELRAQRTNAVVCFSQKACQSSWIKQFTSPEILRKLKQDLYSCILLYAASKKCVDKKVI